MMDNRDEIIRTQLDVIGTLLDNNMRRLSDDLWGAPAKPAAPANPPEAATPVQQNPVAQPEDAAADQSPEKIEDLKAELNELIGLKKIKQEVENLINMVTIHNLRRQNNLKTVDMSLHMVFSGNPGTGKTTIARLMSRIYKSLGILSKGHLVEVDRSGLVAGYVGQTATKTSEVIEKAMGGVLFIDEAYALSAGKAENDFGQEAIDTLLKAMEDHREDLVVIVAGYDALMEEFIHSNPGLESRFNRFLHFEDYTLDEMMQIMDMQLRKGEYALSEDARDAVREYIELSSQLVSGFGNARGVRNIFERLLIAQANRLSADSDISKDELMTITCEDVESARSADDKLQIALKNKSEKEKKLTSAIDKLDSIANELKYH